MNISVPDDLRERMKPFDGDLNWSAIAAAAYAKEVAKHEELAEISDEALRRLRETEIEDEGGFEEMGKKAGRRWASWNARKHHLLRLEKAETDADGVDWSEVGSRGLASIVTGEPGSVWDDMPGGFDEPDAIAVQYGWLHGFSEGALEILDMTRNR